jgi:hypothetical protein
MLLRLVTKTGTIRTCEVAAGKHVWRKCNRLARTLPRMNHSDTHLKALGAKVGVT